MVTPFKEFRARACALGVLTVGWLMFSVGSASAQQVRWQLPDLNLGVGKVSPIELIFENCSPEGDVTFPSVDGIGDFGKPVGRQLQTSIVNFRRTNREVYTYYIRPTKPGRIEVPAFEVKTNAGMVRVPSIALEVDSQPRLSSTGDPVDRLVQGRLMTPSLTVWQGEVFPLSYEILLIANQSASLASDPREWRPSGLTLAPWGEPQNIRRNVGGGSRQGRLYETQAFVSKAGTLELPPIEVDVDLSSGRAFSFFGAMNNERVRVSSNALTLTVKELPTPTVSGFTGAVGQFRMESKITPEQVSVGEPITWSLTVRGTGNWPENFDFPKRKVPGSMRVIEPEAKRNSEPDKPFEATATQDLVIIPREKGSFEIPPVQFSFFNPTKGEYETITTEPQTILVIDNIAAGPGQLATTPSALSGPAGPDRSTPRLQARPELQGKALPRPPLTGSGSSWAPVSTVWVGGAIGVFFLALIPFWMMLARKDAVAGHVNEVRRRAWQEAREALAAVKLAGESGAQRRALLRWQRGVARSQGVVGNCPPLFQMVGVPLFKDEVWPGLWREAEEALYANEGALAPDWAERVEVAMERYQPAKVPFIATFRTKHLFPLILVGLLVTGMDVRAETAVQAYEAGNFAEAQAAWQKRLDEKPGDWQARNNLALALAQQGEWQLATPQWISAWLAEPSNEAVRWNLGVALDESSLAVPEVKRLLQPDLFSKVVTWLAPSTWQFVLLLGGVGAAVGVAFILKGRYLRGEAHAEKWRGAGWAALQVGALVAVVACYAIYHYGIIMNPQVALIVQGTEIKSVPTDAAETQAVRKIDPGHLVIIERSFLGWHQVRLDNSETGWVRNEKLHRLYPTARL